MQTYYQKHQQIQAFQFDGTLKQLRNELPIAMFADLIRLLMGMKNDRMILERPYRVTEQRYLTQLECLITAWPQHHHKNKMKKHDWEKLPWAPPYEKYYDEARHLNIGMYVRILYDYQWLFIDNNQEMPMGLKFYRPNDFSAHWSQSPIRKK